MTARFSLSVDASLPVLWQVLLEKVEDPRKHVPGVDACEILEREGDTLVRRLTTQGYSVVERITIDAAAHRIDSEYLEHPRWTGTTRKWIEVPDGPGLPVLGFELNWTDKQGQDPDLTPSAMRGVKHTAAIAERLEEERLGG